MVARSRRYPVRSGAARTARNRDEIGGGFHDDGLRTPMIVPAPNVGTYSEFRGGRGGRPGDVAPCVRSTSVLTEVRPARRHPEGGSAGPAVDGGFGRRGHPAMFALAVRDAESAIFVMSGSTGPGAARAPMPAWVRVVMRCPAPLPFRPHLSPRAAVALYRLSSNTEGSNGAMAHTGPASGPEET